MPNLKNDEKALLVKNICIRYGHSLIEIALAWFATNNQINDLFIIEGEEHLEIAKKTARPIILGTAHFSCLELGLAKASMLFKSYAGLYRPSKNDLIEYIMYRARMKRGCFMIPHTNIKDLIKKLKEGFSTVYLPDQPDLNSGTNLIPFFDNPCITNLALSKIARISGAIILPMCMRFDKKKNSYVLSFSPHYEPSNDERLDTKHLINIFENYIKSCPEQYLWSYKKFKGRPLCFKQYY
jgi:KDO2-lipid IV(A) lauroyltransferase